MKDKFNRMKEKEAIKTFQQLTFKKNLFRKIFLILNYLKTKTKTKKDN